MREWASPVDSTTNFAVKFSTHVAIYIFMSKITDHRLNYIYEEIIIMRTKGKLIFAELEAVNIS